MSTKREDAYRYPKIFFIYPDYKLLPKEEFEKNIFKEDGYEVFYIDKDPRKSISDFFDNLINNIIFILDISPNSIFFVNISTKNIEEKIWVNFIKKVSNFSLRNSNERVKIGVMHDIPILNKKDFQDIVYNEDFIIKLEARPYKNRVNVMNAVRLLKIDKRSVIRMDCKEVGTSIFGYFNQDQRKMRGSIIDISRTHFSCIFGENCNIKTGDVVSDFIIKFDGYQEIKMDVILIAIRKESNSNIFVFYFSEDDKMYFEKGGIENKYKKNVCKIEEIIMKKLKTSMEEKIVFFEKQRQEAIYQLERMEEQYSRNKSKTRIVKGKDISKFLEEKNIEMGE